MITGDEQLSRDAIDALQARRATALLRATYGRSGFYTRKWDAAGVNVAELSLPRDLRRLPLTTKAELVADQAEHSPWGSVITEPLEHYTRYCQTSSTTGQPLRWIDTNESWQWMLECWKAVYRGARVLPSDRVFFAFSFGPFLGFWTGFEAGCQLGLHCIPGGGMSSQMRLSVIEATSATVVCCTPTYAMRLAEVAAETGHALAQGSVRMIIVAGEPGGSIPATRERIEHSWGARVIDHHGLTEVGPVSFECWESPGALHLNESEYVCEVLDPTTHEPVAEGTAGELVITNLGRAANPVVRYRTGDVVVRRHGPCRCGRTWARLEGGVLARADDMINVRGVNVYPAGIESVVRRVPEVVEFRSFVNTAGPMRSLRLEVELDSSIAPGSAASSRVLAAVSRDLRESLGLTVHVGAVATGSLPRFEMKASRFVVERGPEETLAGSGDA